MFGIIKQKIILSLSSIVNASNHAKCVFLCNQKCKTQPTLINSYPNKYSQKFHYYPFAIKLDRCVESCNTLNDFSSLCSKQNRRFKSERVQHDYEKKWIKIINQAYIMSRYRGGFRGGDLVTCHPLFSDMTLQSQILVIESLFLTSVSKFIRKYLLSRKFSYINSSCSNRYFPCQI